MRVQLRIVAGSLRGRKLTCSLNSQVRPTPDMVREALFNILGNAVPDRPFFDVFAGTGVVGIEALSRGAGYVTFIERDTRLADDIVKHLADFDLKDASRVLRTDAYRWTAAWDAPSEPVNVFVSPPFSDFQHRADDLLALVATLQSKVAPDSVLLVQSERNTPWNELPALEQWEHRHYGRNVLLICVKEA